MSWDNTDSLKWGDNIDQEEEVAPIVTKTTEKTAKRRTTACVTHSERYLYRRAYSETSLLDAMGIEELKKGDCWHFITAGDVDSLISESDAETSEHQASDSLNVVYGGGRHTSV